MIRMAPPKTGAATKSASSPKKKRPGDGKSVKAKARSKKASSVPILRLPPEIVLLITHRLGLQDKLALNRTNRWFYSIINPVIYAENVRESNAFCLFWAAENGVMGTLRHALAAGADLNATGPIPSKPIEIEPIIITDPDTENPDVNVDPDLGDEPLIEPAQRPWATPLHLAAKNGHLEVVRWLLDHGADIDAPSYRACDCQPLKTTWQASQRPAEWPRWRALHTAMCNQEREVAELLIYRGASLDLDAAPGHNHTALHSAAANALVPIIKLLALNDVNLDVNQRDAWNNTALHYVSLIWSPRESPEIRDTVTKLLALGADLEAHNNSGLTPLLYACSRGNYAVAHWLVNIGGNPDPHRHIPDFRDYRPLYYCILPRMDFFDHDDGPVKHDEFEGNRVALIHALVDNGADVDARFDKRTHRGATALMFACELAEPRAVTALVRAGADVNAQDRCGRTPLAYAVSVRLEHRHEVPEITTILLRHGARMDIEDATEHRHCPLDAAAKHIRWSEDGVLEAMLKVADASNVRESKVKEVLRNAASTGNYKALKLLLEFCDRIFHVTDDDIKEYLICIIEQSGAWSQVETFNCLMDFGRRVFTNEYLLHKALMRQNRELCLAILQRGVAVSEPRFHGNQTYLHLACQWGDIEVVNALLERGADVNIFDRELRTPLSIAVSENLTSVAISLMKEVADPFLVPPDDMFREIYSSGDPDEDDLEWRYAKKHYLTAFDIAIREDRVCIVEDIISRFCLPEIPPHTRLSYVHRAAFNPNPTILIKLLEAGADPRGGPGCRNPPFVTLIRQVWDQPRPVDNAVSLLYSARQFFRYLNGPYANAYPWALLNEIALSQPEDDDKRKVKEICMTELGLSVKCPQHKGKEPILCVRSLDLPARAKREPGW